ncbi:MAG: folylpolyglutamate synthase/dihydrofolate synthase family protein [Gemmatimonadota bacterium]
MRTDASPDLARLLARQPAERIVWGLDRVRVALASVGQPQASFHSIHVAGTNGKGSVAAMLEALLRASAVRTGLFTSPHLRDFSERIRVAGEPVPLAELDQAAADLLPVVAQVDTSWFEAVTALAFLALARSRVEWAVVETGLGGRLDATNVLIPDLAVITNVSLDHEDYLGSDLARIAAEKAGIIKEEVPTILGRMPESVEAVFRSRAAEVGSPIWSLGADAAVQGVEVSTTGTRFELHLPSDAEAVAYQTPLPGAHQADNAALALMAFRQVAAPDPVREAKALAGVRWPGRFQVVSGREGLWVLDVAHNPAGVEALLRTLEEASPPGPIVACVAILGDKEWGAMLGPLTALCESVVLTVPPSAPESRRWDPLAVARDCGFQVEVVPIFAEAMLRSRQLAGVGTVIVTGSCHTVGDGLGWLEARMARA